MLSQKHDSKMTKYRSERKERLSESKSMQETKTREEIRQFREQNFPGKDSRKQWSKVSGVSARSIRAYETGNNPVPKWYLKLIEFWDKQQKA